MNTGAATATMGYNGNSFWGPTLIMNKGDNVQINVTNNLADQTTVHWHGFHIPAIMDGGPHQIINAGATWSPNFQVKNNAGTYWYHPHLHQKTQEQLTKGAGGFITLLILQRLMVITCWPTELRMRK
jgi:bilirubin oxidase